MLLWTSSHSKAYGSAHRNDPCALHRQGGGNGERDAIVYCNGGNILSVDLQENKMQGEVPAAIVSEVQV